MCNFCVDHVDSVDYKAVNRLRRYVTDRARIDSSKKTGTCAKHQRMVRRAIVKARFMSLLPYSPDHTRVTNMLAPRTPAEASKSEAGETSTDATGVTVGPPEGESVAQSTEAPTAEAVVQATEVKEAAAVEPAPAAEPATAESAQQETPSASTASAPDVAQPEGKSETDDMEVAKV